MAKFFTGNELNAEVEKIFKNAEGQLILISPYIKLHDRYLSSLRTKKENHKLEITVVFGKNEEDLTKSMRLEDLNFFKEFPNIEIRYEKRLHAKYYANETSAILTSMNLYSFSQDNNIEAGVLTKASVLGNLTNNLLNNVTGEDGFDAQAWKYFSIVIEQSDLIYKKTPQYESGMLGLTKKYKESKVELDRIAEFFKDRTKYENRNRSEFISNSNTTYTRQEQYRPMQTPMGYCIRTGTQIPFNPERPMVYDAFQTWAQFGNPDYPENFCHFSGEPSNGETSYSRPILRKNWREAKEIFNI